MRLFVTLLVLALVLRGTAGWVFGHEPGAPNMLANQDWDCEGAVSDSWKIDQATVTPETSDSYTGKQSFKVTNRKGDDSGARIHIDGLKPGNMYYFSIFIKQLTNRSDDRYSAFRVMLQNYAKTKPKDFHAVGILPWCRADDDWRQLGGDFIAGKKSTGVDFYIRTEGLETDYLIDSAALTEIPKIPDLKAYTDDMIDKNKKTDIIVKGKVDKNTKINVKLTNHEFGHGIAIKPNRYNTDDGYFNFVHKYYNWVVFENAMKWKMMERVKGKPYFDAVDEAMVSLQKHGMPVRGHLLVWDVLETNPKFVQTERGQELWDDVMRRVEYMIKHFKGKINEWDVSNEFLHSHFVEARTKHMEILETMMQLVHKLDPATKCFLNDYQVIRDPLLTSAIADLARFLKKRGNPIDGIGIQGHLRFLPVEPERLWKRLDIAGSAGFPLTITEFSAHSKKMDVRALATEQALRIFMAHPSVHAVMWWGPTNYVKTFATDHISFDDFTPNKAGQAMIDLIQGEWVTDETVDVGSPIRGFRGEYTVTYTKGGKTLTKDFTTAHTGTSTFKL